MKNGRESEEAFLSVFLLDCSSAAREILLGLCVSMLLFS